MSKIVEKAPMVTGTSSFLSEHTRLHNRWAGVVLALYCALVLVGLVATVIHRSLVLDSGHPAMQTGVERLTP
jgi:hypothetical protein